MMTTPSPTVPTVPEKFLYFTNTRETWWPALIFDNYTQLHEILTAYKIRGFSDVRNRSFIQFVERRALSQQTNDISVAILLGPKKDILWGDEIPVSKGMIKSVELMTQYSGNSDDWDEALAEAMQFVAKFRVLAKLFAKTENCGESAAGFTVLSEENLVLTHDNAEGLNLPHYVPGSKSRSRKSKGSRKNLRKILERMDSEIADDLLPFPRLDQRTQSDMDMDMDMSRYKQTAVIDEDDTVASNISDLDDVSRVEQVIASVSQKFCMLPSCGLLNTNDSKQRVTCSHMHSCSSSSCVLCKRSTKKDENLIENTPHSTEVTPNLKEDRPLSTEPEQKPETPNESSPQESSQESSPQESSPQGELPEVVNKEECQEESPVSENKLNISPPLVAQ